MRHVYEGICETGLRRAENQDAIFMKSDGEIGLFAVADGMGGHSHGEVASATIRDCLSMWWDSFSPEAYNMDFSRMIISLNQILEKANIDIIGKTAQGEICGSTVVVIFIYRDKYGMLTAGDSRVYKVEHKKLIQISEDETWENRPENSHLSLKAKMSHPYYGKLVNAIGTSEQFNLTSRTDSLSKDTAFILCSDGIYKFASPKVFSRTLKSVNASKIAETIIKLRDNVYANGAGDNMSLIIICIVE